MSSTTACSNELFSKIRRLDNPSRTKYAANNPPTAHANRSTCPPGKTSSITYCVSFGYAKPANCDTNAQRIVPPAIHGYGRR